MGNPGHTGLMCQDQSPPLPDLSHRFGAVPPRGQQDTEIDGAQHLLVSWEIPLSSGSPPGNAVQAGAEWKCYRKAVTEALKQEMVQTL